MAKSQMAKAPNRNRAPLGDLAIQRFGHLAVFRSAFTLIEIMVVVVIIAVLAGTVIPRLGNVALRNAENEANAAKALLTSIAQRDAMSSQAYALAYDPETSRLGLLSLVDSGAADRRADWAPTLGQIPVTLNAAEVLGASADGVALEGAWKVEFRAATPRPGVSLLLGLRDGSSDKAWRVDLGAGQLVATMISLESASAWQPADPAADDLDAKGARETPW
jgi:prepilin-type N-terminal cleavage/methylation domain-containing protein